MYKIGVFISVLISIFISFTYSQEKIVAVFDGEKITLEQFNKTFEAYWKEILHLPIHRATREDKIDFLKWLIRSKIIKKEAEKMGIYVEEEELKDYIKRHIGKIKLSDPVKNMVKTEVLINKILERLTENIEINEGEIEAYYYLNLRDFKFPKQVLILRVLADTKEAAEEVYKRLKRGDDIYNIDGIKVGKPRWYSIQTLPSILRKRLYPYKIGEVSKPVALDNGYIIVKIIDKKKEGVLSLEEAKPQVIKKLRGYKREEAFRRWFSEVLKGYIIHLYFQYF